MDEESNPYKLFRVKDFPESTEFFSHYAVLPGNLNLIHMRKKPSVWINSKIKYTVSADSIDEAYEASVERGEAYRFVLENERAHYGPTTEVRFIKVTSLRKSQTRIGPCERINDFLKNRCRQIEGFLEEQAKS